MREARGQHARGLGRRTPGLEVIAVKILDSMAGPCDGLAGGRMLTFATAGEPGGQNKKLTIVVFGGHPDDPESGAGGLSPR